MRILPASTLAIYISGLFSGIAGAQIEEVIVTAQKRPENIQDVPISISAYSGNFLEKSGIKTLQDLGNYTPNLTLSQSSQVANQRIIMRGVGSVGDSAIEPSVAVFIDGIYYPRSASVTGTLSDLELVEVLRGPQGTLFGRNASMGALNITTRKPADELEGVLRTSYGNYNDFRVAGSISSGLTENSGGRLSFHHSDRGGYGDNTFTGAGNNDEFGDWEDTSVRGKLNFSPSEAVDINLTLDYATVKNESGVIEVLGKTVLPAYLNTLSVVLNPLGPLPGGPLPNTTDTYDYTVNQDHRDYGDDKQWGGAADISWKLGDHTVRSLTGYRSWENDTFESALRLPADLLNRLTNYQTETFSQEVQLLSAQGEFMEYVTGLYYYDEKYDIDQLFNLGPNFCPAVRNLVTARSGVLAFGNAANAQCAAGPQTAAVDLDFGQELTSFAAYGQVTFNIDEQLHVSGGLRWTSDKKDGSFGQLVPNTILLPPSATNPLAINLRAVDSAPVLDFKDKELTWMLNISYDVTDSVMGYATASTGFKSGGFNADGANRVIPRTFESETVNNYELGLKSSLFENRLVANVGIFRTNIDNFQDRQFDGVNFIVQNVGELIQDGIELDVLAQPNDNLYLAVGLSYLGSEFKSFPNATNLPAVVAAAQSAGTIPATQDLTGERNHFSPEWQVSLVSEWRDNFSDNGLGWFVRGEYQYVDEQNVGAETNQNPQSIQSAYDLVNVRAGLTGVTENWELSVFGKNITDEGYCQTIFNQPIGTTLGLVDATTGGGMQRCVLGTPKTYGVEASYRF